MSERDEREPDRPHEQSRIPYVHGRDLVPIRRQPRRYIDHRQARLFAEEDRIRARIDEVDRLLLELSAERRHLLGRIRDVHDEIRPVCNGARGRRRRAVSHEEPLPPTVEHPTILCGRALRSICLAYLARAHRALTLRELHALLHRAGYSVAGSYPAKALADALGHEVDVGRATRLRRATYSVADDVTPGGGIGSTLPDW